MMSTIKAAKAPMAILLAGALGLAGCNEAIIVAPGTIDQSDPCAMFQQAIIDERDAENQLVLQNTVAGVVGGAVLGAIIAGPDNRTEGAILGGLLGGAAAGGTTAQQQKEKREKDAAVLREVNAKAGTAVTLYSKTGAAAAKLRNCRLRQLNALESNVRNQRISTGDARSQLTVQKRRANVDNRIISAAFNGIGNRVDDFVSAGASAGGVQRSIVSREAAARTAQDRRARQATPNVARAQTAKASVVNADVQRQQQINRKFEAIDVLLG